MKNASPRPLSLNSSHTSPDMVIKEASTFGALHLRGTKSAASLHTRSSSLFYTSDLTYTSTHVDPPHTDRQTDRQRERGSSLRAPVETYELN